MKRVLTVVLLAALCVTFMLVGSGGIAAAESLSADNECDVMFINTINELAAEEGYGGTITVSAQKELVYDINLDELGYVYDFTVNDDDGFAILINSDGVYDFTEIYFNAENPYSQITGKRVYISAMMYAYYSGGAYYLTANDFELSAELLSELSAEAFYSGGSITTSSETINYSHKNKTNYAMALRIPGCYEVGSVPNGCAPVAATNIVVYYDRYYNNLIPDYESGTLFANNYLYTSGDSTTNNLTSQLASYMGTNNPNPGTTVTQFKNGMSAYCSSKNLNIAYSSCMTSSGSFNYNLAKQKINSGLPLVLFVDGFTAATIFESENADLLDYWSGNLAHAMAGFGYREIEYTLSNGSMRSDKYIAVAPGITGITRGYYNFSKQTTVDDVYAIDIY